MPPSLLPKPLHLSPRHLSLSSKLFCVFRLPPSPEAVPQGCTGPGALRCPSLPLDLATETSEQFQLKCFWFIWSPWTAGTPEPPLAVRRVPCDGGCSWDSPILCLSGQAEVRTTREGGFAVSAPGVSPFSCWVRSLYQRSSVWPKHRQLPVPSRVTGPCLSLEENNQQMHSLSSWSLSDKDDNLSSMLCSSLHGLQPQYCWRNRKLLQCKKRSKKITYVEDLFHLPGPTVLSRP